MKQRKECNGRDNIPQHAWVKFAYGTPFGVQGVEVSAHPTQTQQCFELPVYSCRPF